MEQWKKLAITIAIYGVLKELRWLEPFLTKFLTTPPLNFTHSQVIEKIYPYSVYPQWASLIVLFLVTDMLRYKPIIILNSLAGTAIYCLYSFCRSLPAMKAASALTGLYFSCEVAYYTYIYAKVDRSHYQEVTGYTQAAYLIGRTMNGFVAQILVSVFDVHFLTIAYVTLGTMGFGLLWSLSIPSAERSIYFNRTQSMEAGTRDSGFFYRVKEGFPILWNDFISAFKKPEVWKWILWWMVSDGIFLQVSSPTVIQSLWEELNASDKTEHVLLNGAVDSLCTLSAAIGAYAFGKWKMDWSLHGDIIVAVFSLALGQTIIGMSISPFLLLSYGLYIIFYTIYNCAVIIARSQIAVHIKPDSAGLTFGATMLLALLYQSVICGLMTQYFKLSIKYQFLLFGFMYYGVAVIYGFQWVGKMVLRCVMRGQSEPTESAAVMT